MTTILVEEGIARYRKEWKENGGTLLSKPAPLSHKEAWDEELQKIYGN